MLRPIAAGLMCLGFVTLGVAISQGQDDETDLIVIDGELDATNVKGKTDLIVIDGKLDATEVKVGEANVNPPVDGAGRNPYGAAGIEFVGGGEANISVNGQTFRIIKSENGEAVVLNEEGKIVEKLPAGSDPNKVRLWTRSVRTGQLLDPQTRESLEKMAATLKEQIQKLESEGKKDEAQQKTQSLRAIDSLLHGNPRFTALSVLRNGRDSKQSMEEIKKLHARLKELTEQSAKLPEGAAGEREKITKEIEIVKKEIAEKHQSLTAPFPYVGMAPQFGPGQPFPPGMVAPQFTQQPPGAPQFFGGGIGFAPGQPQGFGGSEGTAMLRKSEALSQAAAQLKKNGLDEQAQPLLAQAEDLRAKGHKMMQEEAEKRKAQTAGGGGFGTGAGGFGRGGAGGFGAGGGFGGMAAFAGGPQMDLHNSLRELHEQIQQLRKEVGELRELLQRK